MPRILSSLSINLWITACEILTHFSIKNLAIVLLQLELQESPTVNSARLGMLYYNISNGQSTNEGAAASPLRLENIACALTFWCTITGTQCWWKTQHTDQQPHTMIHVSPSGMQALISIVSMTLDYWCYPLAVITLTADVMS